ncbi:hypothetical protein Q7506_05580 [Glaesserella parasuis]|uniref:hypothetical protein n=1 Tax=Glaesserella parasuis TaxID=738 RepID=UPI0013665ED0|nr:hypothetical protein [Glaesserella parasuis]MDG6231826.1 hypothetical protein [Glaesserella parasuis]MDO9767380.1 hypothetical protein [Glaesserella parasuis]MWQ15151.1 hypothetical protein [Glaesserella parasuis]
MKKLFVLLSALFLTFSASADNLDAQREKVKQIFLSDEEPKVKDAIWTTPTTFKVGVFDDGTRRDGYAGYVCLVLYENGFKDTGVLVHVIDIKKLISTGEWVVLGQAYCKQ